MLFYFNRESNIFHLTGLPEEMDEDEIAEVVVASESLA